MPVAPPRVRKDAAAHLDGPLALDRLAARAGLSGRTLLLCQRLDSARVLLERTGLPGEAVATRRR
ncbi:hypothetical protein [Streptomyces sp. NPDC094437]|uniref:hypothetical protein n=1 Tax=Streptomyces sp. NPDC094437 TaxID=3366060 RepID=UPI0037F59DDC